MKLVDRKIEYIKLTEINKYNNEILEHKEMINIESILKDEDEERKKEMIRRALWEGGIININTEEQYIFLVEEMNRIYRTVKNNRDLFSNVEIYLEADLDMKGEKCPTIERFAGKFYGNGKTIRNVKLNGGFIEQLGGSGLVSGLRFEEVTMRLKEVVLKRPVGIVQVVYKRLLLT